MRCPGMNGTRFLEKVKAVSPGTARFMLTSRTGCESLPARAREEVSGFIKKPWDDNKLKGVVKAAMERYNLLEENRRLKELTQRQLALLAELKSAGPGTGDSLPSFVDFCADLIELHENRSGSHCRRVASLAKKLASKIGLDSSAVQMVWAAALLQNIGLIGIPRDVLEKDEGELTSADRALLRNSPALSRELLSKIAIAEKACMAMEGLAADFGHEDSTCSKGSRPSIGTIISICKTYDRLRHGKNQLSLEKALARIDSDRKKKYDPALVDAFIELVRDLEDEPRQEGGNGAQELRQVSILGLHPGMVLADDVLTGSGRLLVSKGTSLTQSLIDRLINFNKMDPIKETLLVSVPGLTNNGQNRLYRWS